MYQNLVQFNSCQTRIRSNKFCSNNVIQIGLLSSIMILNVLCKKTLFPLLWKVGPIQCKLSHFQPNCLEIWENYNLFQKFQWPIWSIEFSSKFFYLCINTNTFMQGGASEWKVHSTLIFENLKLVEISKNSFNTIQTSS